MPDTSASHESLSLEVQRLRARVAELESRGDLASTALDLNAIDQLQRIAGIWQVLGSSLDVTQSVEQVAGILLETFGCDRIWMLPLSVQQAHLCGDPIEVSRDDWASPEPLTRDSQLLAACAPLLTSVLAAEGPTVMDREALERTHPQLAGELSIQSQILIAVEPELGAPWVLWLQQCSHAREWTAADRTLFRSLSSCVAHLLTCLLDHGQLAAREERLRLAFEAVQDGVWDWNVETGAVVFSARLSRMLGYEPNTLVPHVDSWMQLIHPDDAPEVEAVLKDHLEGKTDYYSCEHRLLCKSGEWLWVLDRGKVIERSPEGVPLRMVGTHKNIATTKQAVLMLERERRLFTGGPCVVFRWVASEGWPVEYASPNVVGFFGHSAEDFMTGRVPYSDVVHPEDLARVAEEVSGHSTSGVASFEQEYRIVRPSGEVRWLYDFTVVNRGEDGEITHFEGYVLDNTERKNAEEQRIAMEAQMQQAQKLESLGILAGGIAHDFNNLLTGVLGHAQLALTEVPADSPAQDDLAGIVAAAEQASELTHQMLAYSGKGRFLVEALDLNLLIAEMIRLLELTISKSASLEVGLDPDLPAVVADGSQLRQVVMNLITNAAEAVGDNKGTIAIRTSVEAIDGETLRSAFNAPELPAGDYVTLEVSDTGSGMDPETLARIFDPFFTTKFTGRGLGLASVQGIIRGHSGTVHVSSAVDTGTTFKVLLPASEQAAASANSRPDGADWTGSGTVLLVDDEETVRRVSERMLRKLGFKVITAEDGPQALAVFQTHIEEIDYVLLDLTMPNMHGDEVFKELRRIKPDVRVILSSGYNQANVVQHFSGTEQAGFIQKPYDRATLARALRKLAN